MLEDFIHSLTMLNGHLIALISVLFFLGILLTDIVLEKNIGWLIAYPNWIYHKIEYVVQKFNGMLFIFVFIFVFNSINLFFGYVSGFLVILPYVLVIWTGLNVGIVVRQTIQEESFLYLFLNPIALFELPAVWISFSLGMEVGIHLIFTKQFNTMQQIFLDRLSVFYLIVLPLLSISALIESGMIRFINNKAESENSQD